MMEGQYGVHLVGGELHGWKQGGARLQEGSSAGIGTGEGMCAAGGGWGPWRHLGCSDRVLGGRMQEVLAQVPSMALGLGRAVGKVF